MAFWKEFCASRNVWNLILPRTHQISCYVFAPNSLITFLKTNFEIWDQLTTFDGGSINPNISLLICVPLTVARTARKMPPLILHTLAPYTAKTKPTIPIIFSALTSRCTHSLVLVIYVVALRTEKPKEGNLLGVLMEPKTHKKFKNRKNWFSKARFDFSAVPRFSRRFTDFALIYT